MAGAVTAVSGPTPGRRTAVLDPLPEIAFGRLFPTRALDGRLAFGKVRPVDLLSRRGELAFTPGEAAQEAESPTERTGHYATFKIDGA